MRAGSAVLILLAAVGGSIAPARAETRAQLAGGVRPVAPFVALEPITSLFNAPGDPLGGFSLDASAPELDFRAAPGTLAISTPSGTLTAHAAEPAVLYGVLPRDAESGRPLKADAPEGSCPTGTEPDCWVAGDPIPTDAAVAGALESFLPAPTPTLLSTSTASPEIQSLFGCGPFWGTDCTADGVDLGRADLGALMQSWPPFATSQPPGTIRPGTIRGDPLPGSVGLPGAPGTRDSTNHLQHPFHDDGIDPLAALSWNFLMLLVAQSGDEQPPIEPGEFDPFQSLTPGQCSFVTPQYCSSVQVFFLFAMQLIEDDPSAPPTGRFLWQTGALYQVTVASGDLVAYMGGTVHVLGLERARGGVAALGVPLVLFPAGAALDPAAAFAVATPDAPEAPRFGLAYATAPEPSATALGATVAMLLASLRSRSARRARVQR